MKKRATRNFGDYRRNVEFEDAYYNSTKHLLRFAVITGLFPISRNSRGVYEFRWMSVRLFWAIFVYLLTSCAVVHSTLVKVPNLRTPGLPFDEYFFTLIFICVLVPHWFFQIISIRSSNAVAEYLTMWNDLEKHFLLVTGRAIKLNYRNKFIAVQSFGTTMGVLSPLAQMFMLGSFTPLETMGFYHILSTLTFFCVWASLQCTAFARLSKDLRKNMLKEYRIDPRRVKIREYRELWNHVQTVVEKMSHSTRYIYGCYASLMYPPLMVSLYSAFSQSFSSFGSVDSARFIGYCVCVLHFGVHVYGVFDAGHFLKIQVTDSVRADLFELRLYELSRDNANEVHSFLNGIQLNEVRLRVCGESTIDRRSFARYVSSMAMYCIILLQIKVTLPESPKIE